MKLSSILSRLFFLHLALSTTGAVQEGLRGGHDNDPIRRLSASWPSSFVGGSKCESQYLVVPGAPPIVDTEDLLIIVGKNCACAGFQVYLRGYFKDFKVKGENFVGIKWYIGKWKNQDPDSGTGEDLKDPDSEVNLKAVPYDDGFEPEVFEGGTKEAKKTIGAILVNLALAKGSINEYAALSNGLSLELPMLFFANLGEGGKYIELGSDCREVLDEAGHLIERDCASTEASVLEVGKGGEVVNVCEAILAIGAA